MVILGSIMADQKIKKRMRVMLIMEVALYISLLGIGGIIVYLTFNF